MSGVNRHTVCWLIRHGQTEWNREQRYQSRTDLDLTPLGQAQATAVGRRLARQPLTAIIHSDLLCAAQTAAGIVRERVRQPAVSLEPDWRDAQYGIWEGLTYRDVIRSNADSARRRFADPWHNAPDGGETLTTTSWRVRAAWQTVLRDHDGGHIAIVTHALPIQLLLCELLGMDATGYWRLRIDLGSLSCVDLYPTAAIARVLNEVPRPQIRRA